MARAPIIFRSSILAVEATMAYADLATKKTMARLSASLNESASDASHMKQSSFARKQLEKMGWSEGTGLGKKRDGMVTHIRTKKREESVGLGGEKKIVEEQSDRWWSDSVGNTLARLQQAKKRKSMSSDNGSDDDSSKAKKKAKKKSKKSKSKSDKKEKKRSKKKKTKSRESESCEIKTYTDHELFVATGGARFGMRAQRRAEGKWARTESGSKLWEEEEEARKKIEWNGLGSAKLLLEGVVGGKGSKSGSDGSDSSISSSAKDAPVVIEEISHKTTINKEKKVKTSKKRKDIANDDSTAKAADKKRRKKDKKKTKQEKTS